MVKNRKDIPDAELKVLFALSGNKCAFPGCTNQIVMENKVLGEMAHMIAYSDEGPRSDTQLTESDRNKAGNLILLCPTHHTIIDKFEENYNIHVLREMKKRHEAKQQERHEQCILPTSSEELQSSMLVISGLPTKVYSAKTKFRKECARDFFNAFQGKAAQEELVVFELKDGRLYTFHNLSLPDGIFKGTYDFETVRQHHSIDMWQSSSEQILYTSLLNRALSKYLLRYQIKFLSSRHRYYFALHEKEIIGNECIREETYSSLGGKRTTKLVIHRPKIKKTGEFRNYCIHSAASLKFHYIGDSSWVFTIRPERYLTVDGYVEYERKDTGRKITRMKSTMYNWQYLQELQFWKEFLCRELITRCVIPLGQQAIIIENAFLTTNVEWRGAPLEDKFFASQEHEENLFSFAAINGYMTDEYLEEGDDEEII